MKRHHLKLEVETFMDSWTVKFCKFISSESYVLQYVCHFRRKILIQNKAKTCSVFNSITGQVSQSPGTKWPIGGYCN